MVGFILIQLNANHTGWGGMLYVIQSLGLHEKLGWWPILRN